MRWTHHAKLFACDGPRSEEIRHDAISAGGCFAGQIFRGFESHAAHIIAFGLPHQACEILAQFPLTFWAIFTCPQPDFL
jgi:hypothetical protein